MATEYLVNIPEYWQELPHRRPKTLHGLVKLLRRTHKNKPIEGLWEIKTIEHATGKILRKVWAWNVITDKGAQFALENLFNDTASLNPIFKYMAITTNSGSSYNTGAIASGSPITTLAVASLPAIIPNGTVCTVDYGGANPETVTLTAQASAGAVSVTFTSWTPGFAHTSNKPFVPNPSSADNPAALSGTVAYQTLINTDFVNSIGVGSGNRQRTISKKFLGASTTAGMYTEAWMCNTNPVSGAGQVASHIIVPQASIAVGIDQIFTFVVKL